jgi:two-component system, OmpR family, sensor kinase
VRVASAETDRLIQLAGDLLLIASSDRDGMPLRIEPVRAYELLESVRNRFAWRARESGRRLEVDVSRDLALSGDRLRLEQALGNLVENALRHGSGSVRIRARRLGGRTELRVSDEGSGLPDSFIERAFDRFSRADEVHGGSGAGLGLAIVDAIARAHGGTARAENGQRTEFWLSLPQRS